LNFIYDLRGNLKTFSWECLFKLFLSNNSSKLGLFPRSLMKKITTSNIILCYLMSFLSLGCGGGFTVRAARERKIRWLYVWKKVKGIDETFILEIRLIDNALTTLILERQINYLTSHAVSCSSIPVSLTCRVSSRFFSSKLTRRLSFACFPSELLSCVHRWQISCSELLTNQSSVKTGYDWTMYSIACLNLRYQEQLIGHNFSWF
jgi:hypothetical protein